MLSALETSEVRACACIHAKIVCPKRQRIQNLSLSQMFTTRILFVGLIGIALLLFLICLQVQICTSQINHLCAPSSCGNLHNISPPFRLKGDPPNCD